MSDSAVHGPQVVDARAARLESQARWRKHLTRTPKHEHPATDITVAVASTFTAEGLVPLLGGELLRAGYSPKVVLGPCNQLVQDCLHPIRAFGSKPDAILLMWRMEELIESPFRRFVLEAGTAALDDAENELAALADAV